MAFSTTRKNFVKKLAACSHPPAPFSNGYAVEFVYKPQKEKGIEVLWNDLNFSMIWFKQNPLLSRKPKWSLKRYGVALSQQESKMQYLGDFQKWQNDLSSFQRQMIQHHSNPSLCPNHECWRGWSWVILWRYSRPSSVSDQSCPILCDPMNCSPLGSLVHSIL